VVAVSQLIQVVLLIPLIGSDRYSGFGSTNPATGSDVANVLGSTFAALVVQLLARLVLTGLLIVMVSRAVLGESVSAGQAWAALRPSLGRLLGFALLATLFTGLGLIACGVGAVYVWVVLSLGAPALVLERAGVRGAISRSQALVRGSWWRVFGIQLVTYLVAGVVGGIIALPFTIAAGGFFVSAQHITVTYLVLSSIGSVIAGTLTYPFVAAVTALLYVDQRMRKEGLDLELARASAAR
jgi:hypothetical protein